MKEVCDGLHDDLVRAYSGMEFPPVVAYRLAFFVIWGCHKELVKVVSGSPWEAPGDSIIIVASEGILNEEDTMFDFILEHFLPQSVLKNLFQDV